MRRVSVLGPLVVAALIAGCSTPAAGSPSASTAVGGLALARRVGVGGRRQPGAERWPGSRSPSVSRPRSRSPALPDWPLAAFGSIWVLAPDLPLHIDGGKPNLVRIDPATNEIVATIELPDRLCQGFVASDDAIWVCAADALVRVDPATNEITGTVPIKGAQAFYRPAFGGGMVWALGSTVDGGRHRAPARSRDRGDDVVPGVGVRRRDGLRLRRPVAGDAERRRPSSGWTRPPARRRWSRPGWCRRRASPSGPTACGSRSTVAARTRRSAGDTQLVRIDPASGDVLAEFEIGGSPQLGRRAVGRRRRRPRAQHQPLAGPHRRGDQQDRRDRSRHDPRSRAR